MYRDIVNPYTTIRVIRVKIILQCILRADYHTIAVMINFACKIIFLPNFFNILTDNYFPRSQQHADYYVQIMHTCLCSKSPRKLSYFKKLRTFAWK